MSTESLLQDISLQLTDLNRKMDALYSEKSLNEDPGYVKAMSEAKKGNGKALLEYTKRRSRVVELKDIHKRCHPRG